MHGTLRHQNNCLFKHSTILKTKRLCVTYDMYDENSKPLKL